MADIARVVVAQPLTDEAWAPFGWIPAPDTDPADGTSRMEFVWGDCHVNVIAHTQDEIEATAGGWRCDRMYRHDTHTQALLALDGPSVMAVAPADVDFSDPVHLRTVRAFLLQPLDALVLHRGTWHWGPFPLGPGPVRLFNVQGRRYAEDNACVELAQRGFAVEVRIAG